MQNSMGCRDVVRPHSSIQVWSVECGGSKGNGVVVPIEPSPHPPSIARLCAPTRCQVRCRVSPRRTVCMEKIADQKDRPRPDGNGNSRKQSPKSRPRKLRTRIVTKKPAINQTLSWPAGSCSPSGHHRQNNHPRTTSATWRMGVPGATGFGLGGVTPPVCRLQPADGCSDSTAVYPSPSRPPPLANVPGPRSDRPPRLTPGPAFVSGIG